MAIDANYYMHESDRAAAIYDGGPNRIIEMCMRFSGLDKDLGIGANVDAFMDQAEEYKAFIEDSKWNQTMEFLVMGANDHPLNAVRAYESREWTRSTQFWDIQNGVAEVLWLPEAQEEPQDEDWGDTLREKGSELFDKLFKN